MIGTGRSLLASTVLLASLSTTGPSGAWSHAATPLHREVITVRGVALPDGRVLLVEGGTLAELYDPARDAWTETASPGAFGPVLQANLLGGDPATCGVLCGRVLVRFGFPGQVAVWRMYDPSHGTGTWAPVAAPLLNRGIGATATVLAGTEAECGTNCGKVLVAGGVADFGFLGGSQNRRSTVTAELFDPRTGAWAPTGSMSPGRSSHAAVLVEGSRCGTHCGSILAVGGGLGCNQASRSEPCVGAETSASLYDPRTGTWTPAPRPLFAHLFGSSATALADGRVLVTSNDLGSAAEVFDPAAGGGAAAWTATQGSCTCYPFNAAARLPGGEVLVMGGPQSTSADLYDPVTNTWSAAARFTDYTRGANDYPNLAVVVLGGQRCGSGCGKVLVTGGRAQLYLPPGFMPPEGGSSPAGTSSGGLSRAGWIAGGGAGALLVAALVVVVRRRLRA